jgi:hypothetical protein
MKINNERGYWCFIPHCILGAGKFFTCKVVASKTIAVSNAASKGGLLINGAGYVGMGFLALILIMTLPNINHWESCKQLKDNSPERSLCQSDPMWPQTQLAKYLPTGSNWKF